MNILEEFWYGNIETAEYDISSSKEYKELLQLISRNEDKLLATMTDEQKELFTKYADCVREYQVMAECLLFQNSFRLGGRMMLEVMRVPSGMNEYVEILKRYTAENPPNYGSDAHSRRQPRTHPGRKLQRNLG